MYLIVIYLPRATLFYQSLSLLYVCPQRMPKNYSDVKSSENNDGVSRPGVGFLEKLQATEREYKRR